MVKSSWEHSYLAFILALRSYEKIQRWIRTPRRKAVIIQVHICFAQATSRLKLQWRCCRWRRMRICARTCTFQCGSTWVCSLNSSVCDNANQQSCEWCSSIKQPNVFLGWHNTFISLIQLTSLCQVGLFIQRPGERPFDLGYGTQTLKNSVHHVCQ